MSLPARYTIAQARNQLSHLVRRAETRNPVELTRRGQPVAVLLSLQQYRSLSGNDGGFMKAYRNLRKKMGSAENAGVELDWNSLRDRSPGRKVRL